MLPWKKKINFNYEEIEANLIKNASSSKELSEEDKYYQALEKINRAAEIFEEAGLVRVSSLLGDILNKFSKAEDFEKYVKNESSHGWMFDKPNDADDLNIITDEEPSINMGSALMEEPALSPEDEAEIAELAGLTPISIGDDEDSDEDFEET